MKDMLLQERLIAGYLYPTLILNPGLTAKKPFDKTTHASKGMYLTPAPLAFRPRRGDISYNENM